MLTSSTTLHAGVHYFVKHNKVSQVKLEFFLSLLVTGMQRLGLRL